MKNKYLYPLSLLILCGLFFGCMKKEDSTTEESSSSTNTAQSISNTDFQITNYTILDNSSTDGVIYEINNDNTFYDNDPNTSSSLSCSFFDQIDNAVFEADDNNTFKASVNDMSVSDCYSAYDLTSAIGSFHISKLAVVDLNGNQVSLEGLKYSQITSFQSISVKMSIYYYLEGSYQNVNLKIEQKSLLSQADGISGCSRNSSLDLTNDCYDQLYNSTKYIGPRKVSLDKLVGKSGLEGSINGIYHTNGTIEFRYNNWTGTMTYGSNPSSAPTYTATNGTDNVSGTFTYDTSNARMGNRIVNSRLESINQPEFLPQLFIERSMNSVNESLMRQRGNN